MRRIALIIVMTATIGCANDPPPVDTASESEQTPSPAVAESATDASDEVVVIDVRSESEWDSGHVEQAVHIPHTEIADRISEVTTDKDAKIVLYCAVGGRAGKAKSALEELGYTNVENGGGYDDVKDRF
ncbi:rhodanese-like domain-containing protein [Thalassoroseus pseudoceratinae]|uniref:rhodanese-like domain-containing protein n=1 Tax=Thalassoroseus pseudoceratinae TaxID=2713176 RepID=UPI0019818E0B|nr:rhodanese-like domain-containing protein [Thalassoroseus pseudoceratinae]